ncbi:MAG: Amuc_1100 family pilus-like protein [Verrucomicrobiota bacterium]|nr:Amuc_1100 family pilus-like protein [Verrucomicrobiota bacterium]
MNWITENKFLAGFLGATLLGAGVLAFLLLSAKGEHDKAHETYQTQSAELNRLLSLTPFPDRKNLAKFEEQEQELLGEIRNLQQSLSGNVFPFEEIGPTQFQDRLREAVSQVLAKANEGGGKRVPEKFYLGFDKYETQPPRPEAAAPLLRQLKAIKLVVDLILDQKTIDKKVATITKLDRPLLPAEADKQAATPPGPGRPADARTADSKSGQTLVNKAPFDIAFSGDNTHFRNVLNGIVSSKEQFIVTRRLDVKNEKDAAPPKVVAVAATPEPPPGEPANPAEPQPPAEVQAAAATPSASPYIFGLEKIDVNLRLEILSFEDIDTKKDL